MAKTISGAEAPAPPKLDAAEVITFLQRNAVFGETLRFRQLDRYEAHYRGTQYDHQKTDWWGREADYAEVVSPDAVTAPGFTTAGGPSDEVTVRDMRPTAPKNLCRTIVNRYTGFLFSDSRLPTVKVENDEDTEALLRAVVDEFGFWPAWRSARKLGGAEGSACMTAHLRDGAFAFEVHNTKNLTVIWKDRRTWTPRGILKMYKYPVEENVVDPKTRRVTGTRLVDYVYRRIITDEVDCTFKPVPLDAGDVAGQWEPDPALTVTHSLGVFPGVWVQNTSESEDMDGDADCEGAWQSLDTLDRLLAQLNKGVILNLDPTPVIGVDEKEIATGGGMRKGSDNALYVGVNGKATYLEMTGQGIEKGLALLAELKKSVCEVTRYVDVDPDKISGSAQSAKAIEYLFAPMIECADELRSQYGPAVVRLLRVVETMVRKFYDAAPVQLPARADGTPQIGKFELDLPKRSVQREVPDTGAVEDVLVTHKLGSGGRVSIAWGPYFAATVTDDKQRIDNAVTAKQGGLVSHETAIESTADIFGIEDVAGEKSKVDEEQAAEAQAMLAQSGFPPGDDPGAVPEPAPPVPGSDAPNAPGRPRPRRRRGREALGGDGDGGSRPRRDPRDGRPDVDRADAVAPGRSEPRPGSARGGRRPRPPDVSGDARGRGGGPGRRRGVLPVRPRPGAGRVLVAPARGDARLPRRRGRARAPAGLGLARQADRGALRRGPLLPAGPRIAGGGVGGTFDL